jgi:hypothetical protein
VNKNEQPAQHSKKQQDDLDQYHAAGRPDGAMRVGSDRDGISSAGPAARSTTAVGAREAEGGKSIIALRSTAMIRTNGSDERQRCSTIKAVHPAGTVITLTRAAVDFIVTEYGVAALRGASVKERVKSLIRVAHPDFRDGLYEDAQKYHLL